MSAIQVNGAELIALSTEELNGRYGALPAAEILALVVAAAPGKAAFANSFGLEDTALQHMLLPWQTQVESFLLDTGRLPAETYDLIERWRPQSISRRGGARTRR